MSIYIHIYETLMKKEATTLRENGGYMEGFGVKTGKRDPTVYAYCLDVTFITHS